MKHIQYMICILLLCFLPNSHAEKFKLPTSVPIEVFKMSENQRGIGLLFFTAEVEQEDEYYSDTIGDGVYDTQAIIYTLPSNQRSIIGNQFETSFTLGKISAELKDNQFTDNGNSYDNKLDKSGIYLGYKPSYNIDLINDDAFTIKNSTSLHFMLYQIEGDFSVDNQTLNRDYEYYEESTGLAFKPTTVIQVSGYPTSSIGITGFAGFTLLTYAETLYFEGTDSQGFYDEGSELESGASDISMIFGYDISIKDIFGLSNTVNLSSVISQSSSSSSFETLLRYTFEI